MYNNELTDNVVIIVAMLLGFEQILRRIIAEYLRNGGQPSNPVTNGVILWYKWTENIADRIETELHEC
jgi:hypothetical protein